jgi:hypothetical protein
MTFGWYQLKLLGAFLGIFEFKFLIWRQSSNVTGRFLQGVNSNILLKENLHRLMTSTLWFKLQTKIYPFYI